MSRAIATLIAGVPTVDTCPLTVSTVDDPTTNKITLVVNGVTYVGSPTGDDFDMLVQGTDRSTGKTEAGWVGEIIINNLLPFPAKNEWSCTQLGQTETGWFRAAPNVNDDFVLWGITCDNSVTIMGGRVEGGYQYIKEYDESLNALPSAGLWFLDDHGYADWGSVDDSGNTGHSSESAEGVYPFTEYDYCLMYFNQRGHFGEDDDNAVTGIPAYGRNLNRKWCFQHNNYLPVIGDHEVSNELGFLTNAKLQTGLSINGNGTLATCTLIDHTYVTNGAILITNSTDASFNGFHTVTRTGANTFTFPHATNNTATADVQASGYVLGIPVWNAFMQPLINEANVITTPADTVANHWAADLGCMRLICPDGVSSGEGNNSGGEGEGSPTVLFGNDQIDDLLEANDTSNASFSLWGMMYTLRDPLEVAGGLLVRSSQNPLHENILPEYQRMFTDDQAVSGNPQPSFMSSKRSNGVLGTGVTIHGDYHHAHVYKNHKSAYTNNLAELIYSVCSGTINGSINFASQVNTGETHNELDVVYDSGWFAGGHKFAATRIEVYGSRYPKEMVIHLIDEDGNDSLPPLKFVQRKGNEAYNEDDDLGNYASVNADVDL